jgi:dihydrodipicolinate synthase/N-acetylneuraminate lyase
MQRKELIAELFPGGVDPLWCPLLTHYIVRHGRVAVDRRRIAAQMRTLAPYVRQFLLAGSTGDGWSLDPQQFDELLTFAAHEAYWTPDARFLVGALAPSTQEVLRRAQAIRTHLGDARVRGFAGVAVCPPVGANVSQHAIHDHYVRVSRAMGMPLAVYQLPQVTGCRIEPETFAAITAECPGIYLFKDSSGTDEIARTGSGLDGIVAVRGAEGNYFEALKPAGGPYDGLLLSTANFIAYSLRTLVDMVSAGERELAARLSGKLTRLVARLFEIAKACPSGNAFSNVSRAVDHLLAHGAYWSRVEPPMLQDGSRLPAEVLAEVAAVFEREEGIPEQGYFLHRYVGLE